MDFPFLIRTYGYPAVFIGTMLQGEAILLICGFLAHQGYLSLWIVWLVGAASAMFGDMTYFQLGRYFGDRAISKLPARITKAAGSVKRMVGRHPNKVMLSMRFLVGTRILLPVLCGTTTITTRHFLLMNALTALLWSGAFVIAGYLFGVAAQQLLDDLKQVELLLVIAIAFIAILYHLISTRLRARREAEK